MWTVRTTPRRHAALSPPLRSTASALCSPRIEWSASHHAYPRAALKFDLDRLAALWTAERAAAAERVVARRRERPLAARVAAGDALAGVTLDDLAPAPGDRTLIWFAADLETFRTRPGDPLRLWWTDPDDREAVAAVVARVRRDRLGVMVDGDVPDRLLGGAFNVDRDDPQATFIRGRRALTTLAAARPGSDAARLRAVLLGEQAVTFDAAALHNPAPNAPHDLAPHDPGPHDPPSALNPSQRAAVHHALTARPLALIHGPPGTGKTRTLVEVVRRAVALGQRVLATAMSNTATDHLAAQLVAAGVPIVRLGHPARVDPRNEAFTLDARLEATEAFTLARRWQTEARQLRDRAFKRRDRGGDRAAFRDALREANRLQRDARQQLDRHKDAILDATPVVCATAAGSDTELLRDRSFDLVVLDEATQAPDPIALVPLLRAPRAVLAGDPEQLPPTIIDPGAARGGLAETIFERLAMTQHEAARMLTVQYRMATELMAFPSATRYGGRLEAHPSVASRRLEDLGVLPDALRPGPLVLVDTAGRGWDEIVDPESGSVENPGQAERTAAEVRRLLSRGLAADAIGVITPYHAQRRRLRALLADAITAGLEVDTVDGFQGREKDAIVVDLVRSNTDGIVGFVADRRRLNVALTRAKRLLMVIADVATLGVNSDFAAFVDEAERQGAWVSAWTDEAEPMETHPI